MGPMRKMIWTDGRGDYSPVETLTCNQKVEPVPACPPSSGVSDAPTLSVALEDQILMARLDIVRHAYMQEQMTAEGVQDEISAVERILKARGEKPNAR